MINLKKEEELDDLEKLSLIDMSYSRLNTYDMCPAKYFYTYIEKQDRLFGPAATLGTIVHSVLEDHVGEELNYESLLESMADHREVEDPDHLVDDQLMVTGRTVLYEFYERHKHDVFNIVGKEVPFSVIVGPARIRGFIDLVVVNDSGLVHVIDYKTGKYEVAAKNAPQDLQLGIYALAMASEAREKEIYAELYYLRTARRKGHLFTEKDIDDVYQRVLSEVQTVINDQFFHPTKNPQPCRFCDFRKNETCKTGLYRFGKN